MDIKTYVILITCLVATMAICRVVPAFVLKGKQLSPNVQEALNLIAPAAFAALVANDLISVGMFDSGILRGCIPLIAAVIVAIVAKKTNSMIICCLVGIGIYTILLNFI